MCIQWLVREAVRAKERYGDNVRKHAVYQFSQRFRFSKVLSIIYHSSMESAKTFQFDFLI